MENNGRITAPIFNVVHSSFVDGPGIRTTIFLKGCPLRCLWCCNPEGQKLGPELRVSYDKCNGCGRCLDVCPQGALSLSRTEGDGKVQVDRGRCDGCGACTEACWYGALDLFGQLRTPEEMFEDIVRDKPFYEASGGGLTIGGGEATLYPEFCLRLIGLCHAEGIPVAIDSCGQTGEAGREVYRAADLVLFDIKGMDPQRHRENTGVDPGVIQENLRWLDQIGKPVIIRVPAIPGYNAEDEELEQMAAFLEHFSCICRVDIIPFHEFGKIKYEQLDMAWTVHAEPMSEQRQQQVEELFRAHGLNVQIGG